MKYIIKKHYIFVSLLLIIGIVFSFSNQVTSVKASDKYNDIVTITGSEFVSDTFNGVDTLYRTGGNDGSSDTYSCAAFVKRYYKEVYGVTVNNFFFQRTPKSNKGSFDKVSTPEVGDIAAMDTSSTSTHWAIVKEVNKSTIVLIEQNWKWVQDGKYVTKVNRTISKDDARYYHLTGVTNEFSQSSEINKFSDSSKDK